MLPLNQNDCSTLGNNLSNEDTNYLHSKYWCWINCNVHSRIIGCEKSISPIPTGNLLVRPKKPRRHPKLSSAATTEGGSLQWKGRGPHRYITSPAQQHLTAACNTTSFNASVICDSIITQRPGTHDILQLFAHMRQHYLLKSVCALLKPLVSVRETVPPWHWVASSILWQSFTLGAKPGQWTHVNPPGGIPGALITRINWTGTQSLK
jgi:hypothetical protein